MRGSRGEDSSPTGDATADLRAGDPCADLRAASSAALQALHAENRAAAARIRACHRFWDICREEQLRRDIAAGYGPGLDQRPEHAVIDPFHIACAEIVAAYGVHNNRARTLLTRARTLITRFPTLVEAMETGRLDEDTADLLARHMRTVDSAHRGPVQREIIDWLLAALAAGRRPGRDALLDELDRRIAAHDPAGVRARRAAATRERHIRLRRGTDGMADLHAHLTAAEASTLYEVLHRAATEQATLDKTTRLQAPHRRAHPRRRIHPQHRRTTRRRPRRRLPRPHRPRRRGRPPGPGAGRGPTLATQVRPAITVPAPLGPDGEPEIYLPRGGPATIEALIELLARSVGATLTVPRTDPGT
ncbi:MAG: DUF222 domain-containing protein, partial [Dietzia sp.]